jgi:hypothetical protein
MAGYWSAGSRSLIQPNKYVRRNAPDGSWKRTSIPCDFTRSFRRRTSIPAYLPTPPRSPAGTWYLILVHNNNVAMRVVVRIMMPVVMFVDDHGWFVSDNDFIGTHHGCES